MKNTKMEQILALKALGEATINMDNFTEDLLKDYIIDALKLRLREVASYKTITSVLGEENKNIGQIVNILVNHSFQDAYALFSEIRSNQFVEEIVETFHTIQYMFFDSHVKISFLMYCYINDTQLDSDIDFYCSDAIFNSVYENDFILLLFENEFVESQFLTPSDRVLCESMKKAILKVKHHPELLKENYK